MNLRRIINSVEVEVQAQERPGGGRVLVVESNRALLAR